ncbi:glycosyltransferase family 4 protein [Nostoc sp. UHCC 0870]|uniref:glycosyltransferase family 4 protein n=1 Tax=Nostoc sp. UHCC 0870 TaxID=2914041 RepID=UPI001EDFA797|nr:glycosyltransferase family 4 protein [Nostoc sp. UHCC 0870]UKO97600.1 glycosyltransferase family 4 protein [Nostoc sp. UHCC 0870]
MNVVVTLEHRFDSTPDGKVWTQTTFTHSFWQCYLEVFDHVRVVARVREVPSIPDDWKQANGQGVSFIAVPYYVGSWEYLLRSPQVKSTTRIAVGAKDAVILRIGSQIASCIQSLLHQSGHPYAVEVVSDPYDVFAPGAMTHPLRPFFRWLFTNRQKQQCTQAMAAAYVTKQALQQRYPCANYSFGVSDVELSSDALQIQPRPLCQSKSTWILIFVGTLAQLYKAPDVLINAVAICVQQGIDLKLTIVGEGKHRTELEAQAVGLGLKDRVCFRGQLAAGDTVRAELDQADVFVLPSHQEGLPRAMVEAMARALPCIGSTVGGIPELLAAEDMVQPGDANGLAQKIREVVTNPERMAKMSARNLQKAKEYKSELLYEQRIAFYRYVREQTELWLKQQ